MNKTMKDFDSFDELDAFESEDFEVEETLFREARVTADRGQAPIRLDKFLKEYAASCKTIRLVGGITKSKVWCKVISEITEKTVEIVNGEHAGAVGSAIMAGVGSGIYESEKQAFYSIYREEN